MVKQVFVMSRSGLRLSHPNRFMAGFTTVFELQNWLIDNLEGAYVQKFLFLVLIALSTAANADDVQYKRFTTWANSLKKNRSGFVFSGVTEDGKTPCNLMISELPAGVYYVSLAVGQHVPEADRLRDTTYIGVSLNPESKIQMSADLIKLHGTNHTMNKLVWYSNARMSLEIKLGSNGRPERVMGRASYESKEHLCILGEPEVG